MTNLPDTQALVLPHVTDSRIVAAELYSETRARHQERFAGAGVPKARAPIPGTGHQQITVVTEADVMDQF